MSGYRTDEVRRSCERCESPFVPAAGAFDERGRFVCPRCSALDQQTAAEHRVAKGERTGGAEFREGDGFRRGVGLGLVVFLFLAGVVWLFVTLVEIAGS